MRSGERVADVTVNAPGGPDSKPPRTGALGIGKEGLVESVGVERCAASEE